MDFMYLRVLAVSLFMYSTAAGRNQVPVLKAPVLDTVRIELTDGSFEGGIASAFIDSAKVIHGIEVTISKDSVTVIDEFRYLGGELVFAHRATHDCRVPDSVAVARAKSKKAYMVYDGSTFDRRTMKPIPLEVPEPDSNAITDSVWSILLHDWHRFEMGKMVSWKHDDDLQIDGTSVDLQTVDIDPASVDFKNREKEVADFAVAILARFRQ